MCIQLFAFLQRHRGNVLKHENNDVCMGEVQCFVFSCLSAFVLFLYSAFGLEKTDEVLETQPAPGITFLEIQLSLDAEETWVVSCLEGEEFF